MTSDAMTRARLRILHELERKKLKQSDLAGFVGWTESRLSKVLHGRTVATVNDLEVLAIGVGLTLTEVVRDHGMEFCAEMTPTEMRLLDAFRALPDERDRDAVSHLLGVKIRDHERRAAPIKIQKKRLS